MAQISQNADGTYTKSHSDTEIMIIKSLQNEMNARFNADQELWANITTLENRVEKLEEENRNLADMQNTLTSLMLTLQDHETRIDYLEKVAIKDVYSKHEMDAYIIPWKLEQIPHVFDTPRNDMFDQADIELVQTGYAHFIHADIYEPHDYHFPENTIRRYTINAYCAVPREAVFQIRYADRCVVISDNVIQATYVDTNGNFSGSSKSLVIQLKEGWTTIQFLVANQTQRGGLIVTSDLFEKADYLSNITPITGLVGSKKIKSGAIESRHISPDMDLVVRTLRATLTGAPSIMAGNPDSDGSIMIGDGVISKDKDEPFEFHDDIRVHGTIYGHRVRLDEPAVLVVSDSEPELASTLVRDFVNGDVFHLKLDLSNYVTRKEFDELKKMVEDLKKTKPIITKFKIRTGQPVITKFQVKNGIQIIYFRVKGGIQITKFQVKSMT